MQALPCVPTCILYFAESFSEPVVADHASQFERIPGLRKHLCAGKQQPSPSRSRTWSDASLLICVLRMQQQVLCSSSDLEWPNLKAVMQDQEYNHESNAAYWATRPVLVTKRTLEIGQFSSP